MSTRFSTIGRRCPARSRRSTSPVDLTPALAPSAPCPWALVLASQTSPDWYNLLLCRGGKVEALVLQIRQRKGLKPEIPTLDQCTCTLYRRVSRSPVLTLPPPRLRLFLDHCRLLSLQSTTSSKRLGDQSVCAFLPSPTVCRSRSRFHAKRLCRVCLSRLSAQNSRRECEDSAKTKLGKCVSKDQVVSVRSSRSRSRVPWPLTGSAARDSPLEILTEARSLRRRGKQPRGSVREARCPVRKGHPPARLRRAR